MPRLPLRPGALALVLALAAASPARAQFETLSAADLRLVWPHPLLDYLAPYSARCFENALRVHERLWGWTPAEPVNVILDDASDYGNAGVWVNPRNSLVVHVAPTNFVYETGPSNERLNFTMNHELVHVLALERPAGGDRLWRALFRGKPRETSDHPETILYGHLAVPRRAAPRWYHEGIAVFMETWLAGGLGRAQGPYDEMVFRAMVRDGRRFYDPLGLEAEGTKVDFQVGVNSYLYGTRFMTYLAYAHSPAQVMDWVNRRDGSRRWFASQFRQVFGESLEQGWREWVAFEHDFQRANLDSVRAHPVTGYRDLSPLALGSVSRAFVDSASGSLVAAVFHPGALAHLAAIPLDGGPERVLHEVKGPALYFVSSPAFDPAGRRLYYTTDNNAWRDLCVLDLATGRTRRLIRDGRLGDLAYDRASGALWAVRHFNGISTIVRLERPYANWHAVWSLPYGLDAYDLDVSPDGRTIAASFAEVSGRQTLRVMDAEKLAAGDTASRTLWDFGNAIPEGFVFSPDGRTLFGSSYYTGVSNIFRYDLARDSMDVVSNAETGFFRPVPTGDDSLIVFRYSGQGFTPARIAPRPLADVSAVTYLGQKLVEKRPELRTWVAPPPSTVTLGAGAAPRPYRALASVRLTTVVPIVEAYRDRISPGWDAELSDPLGLDQFSLAATWTPSPGLPDAQRPHVAVRYRRWDFSAAFRWNPASFYDLVGPTKTSRKGYATTLDWHRELVSDAPHTLELALDASHWGGLDRLPEAQNVATSGGFDQLVTGGATLRDRDLRQSIGAADYEAGHVASAGVSANLVRASGPGGATWRGYPFVQAGLDAGRPIPGWRNASLWLRTAGGVGAAKRDEPFANFYFGGFGNNGLDWQEPKRYREPASLPGEPLDAVAGTNFARAQLDWNLPALRFRRAGTLAFYASWARLALFSTALATNLDDAPSRRRLADAGAQADVRFQLLTQTPLTLSLGWARAFERGALPRQEWMASLKVL